MKRTSGVWHEQKGCGTSERVWLYQDVFISAIFKLGIHDNSRRILSTTSPRAASRESLPPLLSRTKSTISNLVQNVIELQDSVARQELWQTVDRFLRKPRSRCSPREKRVDRSGQVVGNYRQSGVTIYVDKAIATP